MKAIQLFYIFIASFSLSFILSCIYFKIFGRKRVNNSYYKAMTLALDNAKDEKFFKTKRELDIAEMHKKYNLSEDEWMFESCNFTNIYMITNQLKQYLRIFILVNAVMLICGNKNNGK